MSTEAIEPSSPPFGARIPDSPHAVSVSLPTIADVNKLFIDRDQGAWARLDAIYPRFGDSPQVREALGFMGHAVGREIVAVSSPGAAEALIGAAPGAMIDPDVITDGPMTFIDYKPHREQTPAVVALMRTVTGWVPSTRATEDFLYGHGLVNDIFEEETDTNGTETTVRDAIKEIYSPNQPEVFLTNNGMGAANGAVLATHEVRNRGRNEDNKRDIWITFGPAYHDTEQLMLGAAHKLWNIKPVRRIGDIEALEEAVEMYGDRIAGVITEAVTNPLIEIPDLEQTKKVLGDIPLIVDVSTAGSALVDVLPHADLIVDSTTKTASGSGDVMGGAIIVNTESVIADDLIDALPSHVEPPYIRDIQRLAHLIPDWRGRVERAGANVVALAEFLESHDRIKDVFWSGADRSSASYQKILRGDDIPVGIITTQIKRSIRPVYDRIHLPKGPSFGTEFTLLTPYVHIAHADAMSAEWDKARQMAKLQKDSGLNERMLRISVGSEDTSYLLGAFEEGLAA